MTLLGRFDLLRSLGMGASGAVFEAVDRNTAQTVALKLLHRCEPSDLYRIKSEFRALTEIAHPNLVAMHELFVDEQQRRFFTMELIGGQPFLQYVRPKPSEEAQHPSLPGSPRDRLRACLEQLAHGVLYLHAHGKLHRDLKPSNVLVNPLSGRLTIVDFGLVRSLRDAEARSVDCVTFEGTPAYAAPEVIDPHRAVFATDWYSVGVMLYEALTGKRPFETADSVLTEKVRCDPPPPSAIADELICPELEEVCMRLLDRDPTRRADGRELLAALGSSEEPCLVEPIPAFVGREVEIAHLERTFERALATNSGGLSIVGQSGIGKTSLAHAFLDRVVASGRARVLRGRCYVQEALHYNAFDGILDALADDLRELPASELAALAPSELAASAQLFPILRRVPAVELASRSLVAPEGGDVRVQAFAALRALLGRSSARGPLVLFIDDLQWADADSARLLRALLSPPIAGMWVVATERSDEGFEGSAFDRLGYGSNVQRLSLGPLSEDAVATLARRMIEGCETTRADRIARRSGGHPLFASELIRHARADGDAVDSIALESAIAARLRSLSAEAQSLLELVCLAGQRVPQSLLLEGQRSPQLAALRELRVASAIRDSMADGEQHVEPYHDRIRELVVARLSAARRQALHTTLAERMRARGSAYLERVIQSYVLAGREHEAAMLAEEAAEQAARGFAFHSAAELLELALRHAPDDGERQRLRLVTASACERAGRTLAAGEHFERAADLVNDAGERSELLLRAAVSYLIAGHSQRGRALLKRIVAELEVHFELQAVPHAQGVFRLLAMLTTGLPKLQALSSRVVYGQAVAFLTAFAAFSFGRPSWLLERGFARAERLVRDDSDTWEKASVRVMRGGAALFCAQDQRAIELCDEAATATQLGGPFAAYVRTYARGVVLLAHEWRGNMGKLAELSDAWLKEAIECGDRHMEVTARIAGLHAHLARDDVRRANREIELAEGVELDYLHAFLKSEPWWSTRLPLYCGELERAQVLCESMQPSYAHYARYHEHARSTWCLIEGSIAAALALRAEDRARNVRSLQRCARAARLSTGRRAQPIAAQLSACVALLEGKRERAAVRVRRAIDGYDALGSRLYSASLRLALARLEPERAASHERAALAAFTEAGVVKPRRFASMLAPGLISGDF